jgi:hypothetical protein
MFRAINLCSEKMLLFELWWENRDHIVHLCKKEDLLYFIVSPCIFIHCLLFVPTNALSLTQHQFSVSY